MKYSIVFECAGFNGIITQNTSATLTNGRLSMDVDVTTPGGQNFIYTNGTFQTGLRLFDEPRTILSLLYFLTLTPESGKDMADLTLDEREWHESKLCAKLEEIFGNDDIENDIVYSDSKSTIDWDVYMVDGDVMLKMRKEFNHA